MERLSKIFQVTLLFIHLVQGIVRLLRLLRNRIKFKEGMLYKLLASLKKKGEIWRNFNFSRISPLVEKVNGIKKACFIHLFSLHLSTVISSCPFGGFCTEATRNDMYLQFSWLALPNWFCFASAWCLFTETCPFTETWMTLTQTWRSSKHHLAAHLAALNLSTPGNKVMQWPPYFTWVKHTKQWTN